MIHVHYDYTLTRNIHTHLKSVMIIRSRQFTFFCNQTKGKENGTTEKNKTTLHEQERFDWVLLLLVVIVFKVCREIASQIESVCRT